MHDLYAFVVSTITYLVRFVYGFVVTGAHSVAIYTPSICYSRFNSM